jgi:hypothetical protein
LNVSNNGICQSTLGPKRAGIQASEGDVVQFEGDEGTLASWNGTYFGFLPLSGVKAISAAIKNSGALTKLDISSNSIPSRQQGGLQQICAAGGIELVI